MESRREQNSFFKVERKREEEKEERERERETDRETERERGHLNPELYNQLK
jgi:hypothetical protein